MASDRAAALDLQFCAVSPDAVLPRKALPEDAGLDLALTREVRVNAGERTLAQTGLAVAIPPGHVGLIVPRSGLALDRGLTVLNSPGVIDPGYRGEVGVVLVNLGEHEQVLPPGARVAQLLLVEVTNAAPIFVDSLPGSVRNAGGFGSSGD
jgi:dUTP pyrophosphatase